MSSAPTEAVEVFELGSVGDETTGTTAVHGFRLRSGSGIDITLTTFGAGLLSLRVPDPRGDATVLVTHPVDLAALQTLQGRFVGSTIGRFANRIAGASFELGGTVHRLEANDPPNHLHGGSLGFHSQVWDAEVLDDALGVCFTLTSAAGDGGYPGTVSAEALYRLVGCQLEIDYRATTDAPTPISLTNHAYWNLAGPDGDDTIGAHHLRVGLDEVLLVDGGIPQPGPPIPVAGTRYEFDGTQDLRQTLTAGGLDHCFVAPIDPDRVAVVLEHPGSGRRLSITTDQPGVQVYTGQHFIPPHQAIAFEPQRWPDSPNRPDFPSVILHPGEVYRSRSVYRFHW